MNTTSTSKTLRAKGHRLETIGTRGGMMAACTCGEGYNPNARRQVFETWEREKMRALHAAHVAAVIAARTA